MIVAPGVIDDAGSRHRAPSLSTVRIYEFPDPSDPSVLRIVEADTYRIDGGEAVFVEKYVDHRTGSKEREVLRVTVAKPDIVRVRDS